MMDLTTKNMTAPILAQSVAVIIPFYNGAEFIERAIRSVHAQTIPPDEVIVVNDGSRAEDRAALEVLSHRHAFRIVDKENGGQGSARNAGVAASNSRYICFLDQDDFFLENHVEALLKAVPPDDARFGFVYADVCEADGLGQIIRTSMIKERAKDHPKKSVFEMIRADMFVLPSAALISRCAFEAVHGFDEQFMGFEDDDLFLRIFRSGFSNYFVDRPVTVWCIHTASTSFGIRMSRSRFKYFKKLAEMFPDEPLRHYYYLRDHLVPRFGKLFVIDVIKSMRVGDPHLAERVSLLEDYARIVLASPSVGSVSKLRLRVTIFLLRSAPRFLVVSLFEVVGERLLHRLRRLLP
jgi:glycosyltransferase involved in cell wall biosynthesis